MALRGKGPAGYLHRPSFRSRGSEPSQAMQALACRGGGVNPVKGVVACEVLQPPLGAFEVSQVIETLFSPGVRFHRDDCRYSLVILQQTISIITQGPREPAHLRSLPPMTTVADIVDFFNSFHDSGQPTTSLALFVCLSSVQAQAGRQAGWSQEAIVFFSIGTVHHTSK